MFQSKLSRLIDCAFSNLYKNHMTCRYVRTINRRGIGPKLVKGEVKTIDDGSIKYRHEPSKYDDFVKEFKYDTASDVLDIEKDFAMDCEFGNALLKSEQLFAMHESEEKSTKSMIKRTIIQRKYFKLEKETNLLTHAAKEQIRYLHKLNPTEWTPEVISKSFPISIKGVKKLLRSNFRPATQERIKQHDADVARKWEILKSGKYSTEISNLTLTLWKEGKLVEDNYRGNSELPNIPVTDDYEVIERKPIYNGEFSSIIKKYVEYKQRSLPNFQHNTTEKQLCERQEKFKSYKTQESKYFKKLKYAPEEIEDINVRSSRSNIRDDIALPHTEFKENFLPKSSKKRKESQIDDEYQKWIEQQSNEMELTSHKTPYTKNVFEKIQKYEKKYQDKPSNSVNDGKQNFQYAGDRFKEQIHVPKRVYKKGNKYKKENCVYDEDGNILFRLPY